MTNSFLAFRPGRLASSFNDLLPLFKDPSKLPAYLKPIASQINNFLSSSPKSLTSSRLCFKSIGSVEFTSLLAATKLSNSSYRYNSGTNVLSVQLSTAPLRSCARDFFRRSVYAGPITPPTFSKLNVDYDYSDFKGEYKLFQNLPDAAIRVHSYGPTIVLASGWSEDYDDLLENARIWLVGSGGGIEDLASSGSDSVEEEEDKEQLTVNAVMIVTFDHSQFDANRADPSNSIIGTFEIWRRDKAKDNDINKCLSTVSKYLIYLCK